MTWLARLNRLLRPLRLVVERVEYEDPGTGMALGLGYRLVTLRHRALALAYYQLTAQRRQALLWWQHFDC